jgi:hypothetical protein
MMPADYSGGTINNYASQSSQSVHDYYALTTAITEVLAVIAAGFLVYVTYGLRRATDRLATSTEDLAAGAKLQSDEMRKARDLSEKEFSLSEKQLDLADRQFLLVGDQHNLTERQHGLQREQFYAQYRPKLEVTFVKRLPTDPNHPTVIAAEFVITNTGESEANVTGSLIRLDWIEMGDLPVPNDLKGKDVVNHRRFLVGTTDRAVIESSAYAGVIEQMPEKKLLFLFGWIVYVDGRGEEFGSSRTTYFLRYYDYSTKRFEVPTTDNSLTWEWNSIH